MCKESVCSLGLYFGGWVCGSGLCLGCLGNARCIRKLYRGADFLYKESVGEDFCEGGMDAGGRLRLGLRSLGIHPIRETTRSPQCNFYPVFL